MKNIVRLCLLADMNKGLEALCAMSQGLRTDICTKGGSYDKVFRIDSETYLTWAVKGDHNNILRKQLEENTDCYLGVMKAMPAERANKMMLLVKEHKPELYKKLMAERRRTGNREDQEKLIAELVKNEPNPSAAYTDDR